MIFIPHQREKEATKHETIRTKTVSEQPRHKVSPRCCLSCRRLKTRSCSDVRATPVPLRRPSGPSGAGAGGGGAVGGPKAVSGAAPAALLLALRPGCASALKSGAMNGALLLVMGAGISGNGDTLVAGGPFGGVFGTAAGAVPGSGEVQPVSAR